MLKIIERFIQKRPLPVEEQDLRKYDTLLFKDKSIQQELAEKGFAVRNLLSETQINQLKKDFDKILQHPDNEIGTYFWNSGRAKSVEVRNMAKKSIDENVKPFLEDFFLAEKAELMGGVFVAKPASEHSQLNPHQDSSHVEENQYISVYCWCTLTDVDVKNGAMHVVPGSHRFGNTQRSLNIPWQFEPHVKTLWKYAKPIPMKAGQVLFFDSAAIHCSQPNHSKDLRLAVNFFVKPSNCRFLHYYRDEKTPEGLVEKYEVDMSFYYDKAFTERPGSEYLLVGYDIYNDLQLDEKKVKHWCKMFQ